MDAITNVDVDALDVARYFGMEIDLLVSRELAGDFQITGDDALSDGGDRGSR